MLTLESPLAKSPAAAKQFPPETGFNQSAVVLLGMVGAIQVSDPLIASLTLVKASAELNFTASIQSLAAGISTLALAATAILGGVLADKLGRRNLLFFSVFMAAAGELVTASSMDATMYLLGRVISGVALGVTFGASYGMLRNVASQKSLGPAMALFNIMNGVIPVVAVVLTGVLMGENWRLAWIMLPIYSMIVVWFIPFMLPKVEKVESGKMDIIGLVVVAIGITGILYGVSQASNGLDKPTFYVPVLVGIAGLALFGIRESKSSHAVFPIKILAHPAFLGAVIMGTVWNLMNASMGQMLPNFWQYVTHMKSSLIGAASLPESAAGILGSVIAGFMLGRGSKARTTSAIGYCLLVVGFLQQALMVRPDSNYAIFLVGMVLAGAGWMMNATSQGNLFIQLAPARYFGPVSSSKMMVGQFGYSLGLTGSTVLVSYFTLKGVHEASNGAVTGDGSWNAITDYMTNPNQTPADAALAAISPDKMSAIYTSAYTTTMLIVAIIGAIAGTAVYLLLKNKKADIPTDVFLGLTPETPAAAPAPAAKTKNAATTATSTKKK